MNLIKDRDARTKARKKAKDKLDKDITLALAPEVNNRICTLALNQSEGKVRLLDEGAIVYADGDLDLYIEKGTIKKYVQGKNKKLTPRYLFGDYAEKYYKNVDEPMNLDEKYEGSINVGHHNFATFPFIVGSWKQSDLSLVDNGDGRKGLDVELKLNEAHPFVQAFRVQGIPLGVSVEMWLHLDDKATEEESNRRNEFTPVVDEIFIADFAIVGECGNVGSSGSVDLQGVKMKDSVKDTEDMEDVTLEDETEETETSESVEDTVEETPTDAPTEEDAPTDAPTDAPEEETADEATEEEVESEDESADEGITDEAEGEEGENEEDALTVAEQTIETLKAENKKLAEQVEALKASNRKKDKKIKEYADKSEQFKQKYGGLSVSLGIAEKKDETKEVATTHKRYATGDGIGE